MSSNKYLTNNNRLKKTTLNLFIPILLGVKNNKVTKTFYYESMYYKNFYLIFNNLSLIEIFFKDKKIFYNFSKYFQFNLYIYLIKTNFIILNFFFHFFYTLFLTFENNQDFYTNKIFFSGYKQCVKHKRISKGWIKPDYGIKFYFAQRVNSISLYVLNFNIYKNIYFYKYNLFSSNVQFIYKLFYYFKMLQYKLQSFVILYKRHFKIEKKVRVAFAKVNVLIYKNLNNKLIKLFSFYKMNLIINKKQKQTILNSSLYTNEISGTFEYKDYDKIVWPNSYRRYMIRENAIDAEIDALKKFKKNKMTNSINFDQELFEILFANNYFSEKNFDFLYNILAKLQWIKTILNKKIFYVGTFYLVFYKFLFSTKFFSTCYFSNLPFIFRNLLDMFHYETMNTFIINVFDVHNSESFFNTLSKNTKEIFIDYVYNQTGFNLVLNSIEFHFVHNFSAFYTNVTEVFEHFLDADFHNFFFYKHMNHMFKTMKKYYRLFPADSRKLPKNPYGKKVRSFLVKKYFKDRKRRVLNYILHQKLYKEHYIYDPENHHYHKIYKEDYWYVETFYGYVYTSKEKYYPKSNISAGRLFTLIKKNNDKKTKIYLLKLLSKKLIKPKKYFKLKKKKINKIIDFFYKRKKKNNFFNKINTNKIDLSKYLALKNSVKFKTKYFFLKNTRKLYIKKKNILKKFDQKKKDQKEKLLKFYNKQFFYATKYKLYDIAIPLFKKIHKLKKRLNKLDKKIKLKKKSNILKKKIIKKLKKKRKNKFKKIGKSKIKNNKNKINFFQKFNKYNTKKVNKYKQRFIPFKRQIKIQLKKKKILRTKNYKNLNQIRFKKLKKYKKEEKFKVRLKSKKKKIKKKVKKNIKNKKNKKKLKRKSKSKNKKIKVFKKSNKYNNRLYKKLLFRIKFKRSFKKFIKRKINKKVKKNKKKKLFQLALYNKNLKKWKRKKKKRKTKFDKFISFKKNMVFLKKTILFYRIYKTIKKLMNKYKRNKRKFINRLKLRYMYRKLHILKYFVSKNKKNKLFKILGQKKNYKSINWNKFFLFLHYFTLTKRRIFKKYIYINRYRKNKFKKKKNVEEINL